MTRFVRPLFVLVVAVCFISTASAAWKPVAGPLPDDPMGVKIFRLENGLEVYLSENHETPRMVIQIAVRTGSKYDPDNSTGLAHYMEHLLFKGSQKLGTVDFSQEKPLLDKIDSLYEEHFNAKDPGRRNALYLEINRASEEAAKFSIPNELDRIYKTMGCRNLNAHTWHEEVVYDVDLPANRLRPWAVIEGDRFQNPIFRLFQTELETVYEEMNRALDNKERVIQYAVDAKLYKLHPYGQKPTLGSVEHLKNPSLKNLHSFYKTWYVPNNMAIFISGDINSEEVMPVIDEYFSSWKSKELPEKKTWEEAQLTAREEVRVQYQAEEFVLLAFRTAPRNHTDSEALMMVDMLMDNSVAGLINLNLNQQQRVVKAGAFPMQFNDYGAEYLFGIPKPDQSKEEVERLLLEQLEHIKKGEFEDWLIPAIINDFKRNEKTGLESDEMRAGKMCASWIAFDTWEHAMGRIKRMEAVTREDVVRVANQYFGAGYVAGYREDKPQNVPQIQKPVLPKIGIDPSRESAFARQILDIPCPPIDPVYLSAGRDYERKEDGRGIAYFQNKNKINDIFTFAIRVDGGLYENPLAPVAARLMGISGTERLSPQDLKKEWYKLGTTFNAEVADHETIFTLMGLDENFEASVALLMELASKPKIEEAALEQLKTIILRQREDAKKQVESIADALTEYNRFGDESHFLKRPSTEQIKTIKSGDLQRLIRELISSKQSLCYTGTLSSARVREIVTRNHAIHGLLDDPVPYARLDIRDPQATELFFVNKESAQAHIQIDSDSVVYNPALGPASQLYNSYFADGMAGIVFQELREARALAYVAAARYMAGNRKGDKNYMMGIIQTQPDKTVDALTAFIDLLDNMPKTEERYIAAREALLNSYRTNRVGFRQVLDTVLGWERRGIFSDPRPEWYETIKETKTLDAVIAFQQKYVANKPKVVSIVGDKNRIKLDSLKAKGSVKELQVDQLFAD